jgi:hypothetical protein
MTKILLNITTGFQARMLLRSATAETLLASGASLIVLSSASGERYFRQEFEHPRIILEDLPSRFSRVEANLITLRQYLLMNPSLGRTLNYKNEAFRRQAPKRYWLARAGNSLLGRMPRLRRAYQAMERSVFRGREFDEVLLRHRPDLIVTGSPGYIAEDIHLLRAARRLGIPSATVMLSWDNLTSKGYMAQAPDHLLVWSDLMADEAVRYHDFPREPIHWCGAAQFDHYFGIRNRLDRAAWRRAHGVPADAGMIVYGTINPALVPHEIEILRQIVAAMRSGRFGFTPYLWIRLHPQVIRGQYARSLEPFRQLAGPDVTVEEPCVQSDKLAWDLPKEDAYHLAELLAAADVVVTPNSTLSIDAACAGTPIINLAFDGDAPVPPELSVRRFIHYTHAATILETGGIALAESVDDFVRLAKRYVADPTLGAEGRDRMIRQQLGRLDGRAGERTADTLLRLAAGEHAADYAPPHEHSPQAPVEAERG